MGILKIPGEKTEPGGVLEKGKKSAWLKTS